MNDREENKDERGKGIKKGEKGKMEDEKWKQ